MEDDYFPEETEYDYMIGLTIDDIYLMYHCVQETIKNWPGSPARPWGEQESLWALRDNLYRMILDYKFREM